MDANTFDDLHGAMRAQVDQEFLPCVATALLRGREVVDRFVFGFADREAGIGRATTTSFASSPTPSSSRRAR
jgi:hypothetical protein